MAELRNATAARWDWDKALRENGFPNPFPRGITHADVDCEIEINGHFFVVEGKRTGESLKNGQRYTSTARVRDGRTCLVVYGTPETHELDFVQQWPGPLVPANWGYYWRICSEWAKWAGAQPRPTPRSSTFRLPPLRTADGNSEAA